ncbi:MAG: c-type cytochrome [Gemmatimonadales bacterium]
MTPSRSRLLPLVAFVATATLAAACSSSTPAPSTAPRASAAPAAPAPPARPPEVTAAAIAEGDSLYAAGSCSRCHGPKGVGTPRAPSLVTGPWLQHKGGYAEIVATIANGVPRTAIKDTTHRFPMNPRGGPMNLTDPQVKSLAAYVWSISRDKR